jgi:hypothetical protein
LEWARHVARDKKYVLHFSQKIWME